MRNSLATKLLSIAMMVLTPAAMLMAETGNTMLYASGNVALNGQEVARSASVATGDKIETAGATATAVSQDGSKVTVNPYSAVKYEKSSVSVVKGSAAINTTDGMAAQAAQITVTPKEKTATYEIARVDNNVVISSHTGALMITDAGVTTRQAWIIAAAVGGASVACGLNCGMSAAQQEPANGRAITTHQGRGMNRAIQVARVAAAPVLNGVSNSARLNAQGHNVTVQHRNIRAGR